MKATYRYRSAITGRYVSAAFAKRNPRTTMRERVTSGEFNRFCKGNPTAGKSATRHV